MKSITYGSGLVAALALAPSLCAATQNPIFSSDPDTAENCIDWWNNSDDSKSCEYVRDLFGITPEQFARWNPSLSVDCEPWRFPLSYCVSTTDRVTTTTTSEAPTTTTSTSSHVPSPTSWKARGCYPDTDPDYPVLQFMVSPEGGDSSLDISSCEDTCWEESVNGTVLYAGVKDGNQCWCSNYIGGESTNDQDKCDTPCSGDDEEICGGEDHINVFEPVTTKDSTSTTTTPTPSPTTGSGTATTTSSSAIQTESDSAAARKRGFL